MASKRAGLHKVMRRHLMESLGIRDGHVWTCFYCHHKLREYGDNNQPDSPIIEHRNPLMRGGSDTMSNLRLACVACNTAKGTKTEYEFMGYDKPVVPLSTPITPEISEYEMEHYAEVNRLLFKIEMLINPPIQAGRAIDELTAGKRIMNMKKANW
mgnify:CR=1 FL=1